MLGTGLLSCQEKVGRAGELRTGSSLCAPEAFVLGRLWQPNQARTPTVFRSCHLPLLAPTCQPRTGNVTSFPNQNGRFSLLSPSSLGSQKPLWLGKETQVLAP